MTALSFMPGPGGRSGLPDLLPVNMFAEQSRTEPTGVMLVGRPRLQNYLASAWLAGTGVGAAFQQNGVLSDKIALLIGTSLYVDGSSKGTVSGSSSYPFTASIAGLYFGIVAVNGAGAKFWDGSTFRSVAFPDGANVTKVLESQGRFIFLRADTHRYYWTEPLDNMIDGSGNIVIDALDYASAESEPDYLVDALVFRDQLFLGGTNTIEMHGVTGNDDLPWSPTLGSTIPKGVMATGCMTKWNNTVAWISPDCIVWQYDGSAGTRVSTPSIERDIRNAEFVGLDIFTLEGHEFLRVKNGGGVNQDLLLDAQTGEWSRCPDFFTGPAFSVGGDLLFGSSTDGTIYALSAVNTFGHGYAEANVDYEFYFGTSVDGGQLRVDNVLMRCAGSTGYNIGLRVSRDRGNTWGNWRSTELPGPNRTQAVWRSWGDHNQPGPLFHARVAYYAGALPFFVSGTYVNEPLGGRSR